MDLGEITFFLENKCCQKGCKGKKYWPSFLKRGPVAEVFVTDTRCCFAADSRNFAKACSCDQGSDTSFLTGVVF